MNIYVGNLPFTATEAEVREIFSKYGQVASVSLITDRMTGQPRGFGFVEMPAKNEADAAIAALNGKDFGGRKLTVNEAKPRGERGGGGGGGGSFRGGGGGGGGRGRF